MFSFLELSEMVQCDKCIMGEEAIMQRTPETGKKSRGSKPDDTNYQCKMYVMCLVPARKKARPKRACKGILWNYS